MDIMDIDFLCLSLHRVAKDHKPHGISGVARKLVMRERTLITKLNPDDDTHFPNLPEFVKIMMATENTEPLDILCEMFGGQFATRTNESMASLMGAVLHSATEGSDVWRVAEKAMADGTLSDKEAVELLSEISEARKALAVLENTVKKHRNKVAS